MKSESYKLFFKAFSNDTRLSIIQLLREGPRNVSQIVSDLGFEQSRISHNLKCLEACGFVLSKSDGKNKVYSLDEKHIVPILDSVAKHIGNYEKRLTCCGVLKNKSCGVVK